MPRRSTRRSPEAPEIAPSNMRLRNKLIQSPTPIPPDLISEIVANWKLPSNNINACVPSDLWPLGESDPEKWSINIVRLLHEASGLSKGKNDLFQSSLEIEIFKRQTKNRSMKGKEGHMTVTDLKHICKHLRTVAEGTAEHEEKEARKAAQKSPKEEGVNKIENGSRPARRGRSNGEPPSAPPAKKKKTPAPRGKPRPPRNRPNKGEEVDKPEDNTDKENNTTSQPPAHQPPPKRLPIRTTRTRRGPKSPQPKTKLPPPVTPANPPEDSASEASSQNNNDNTPPEPVSGRHIYGAFIKPTTITFPSETSPPAPALGQRTTRKRARAEAEEKEAAPTTVQVDSDPRDIDATGFLSELDPREASRRRVRKPRLSGLGAEPVDEPAWSQDVVALLDTPVDTPLDTPLLVSGTPGEGLGRDGDGDEVILGIEMLTALLPGIPAWATEEEREVLEDRIRLIHRDIRAYKRSVAEIRGRDGGGE